MKKLLTFAVLFAIPASRPSTSYATKTFYIDQVINYPSPCTQATLWDDSYAIKSRMEAASWTGQKWTDSDAWVKDFRESCSSTYGSGGMDNSYADAAAVSIFSGHGSTGTLYFGSNNDACSINIDNQSRLGSMSGAGGAIAMYFTCDTLMINAGGTPLNGQNEWLQQQLGFHGTIGDLTTQYASFFDDTSTKNNAQAWLDRFSGQASDVITYSNGSGNCWDVAASAKMKADIFNSPRGSGPSCGAAQPNSTWCTRWAN
jgi:hypothetical protein